MGVCILHIRSRMSYVRIDNDEDDAGPKQTAINDLIVSSSASIRQPMHMPAIYITEATSTSSVDRAIGAARGSPAVGVTEVIPGW